MGNCTSNNQVQPGGVRRVSYPKQVQNESISHEEKSSNQRRPSQLPEIKEEEELQQPIQEESSKQNQNVEVKETSSKNDDKRKSIQVKQEEKPQQSVKEETSQQSGSIETKERSSKESSQKEVSENQEDKSQQSPKNEEVENPVAREEPRKSIVKEEVREEKQDVKKEDVIVKEEARKSIVKEEVREEKQEIKEEKPIVKEEVRKSIVKEEVQESVKEENPEQNLSPSKSSPSEQVLGVLTPKEKELFNMINEYRQKNNLKAIPFSPCLTKVAQLHAKDVVENSPDVDGGNMHSWSDKGPWKGMKYTDDHKQAALMWSKPSELTSYKGNGFEISHGYVGNDRKTTESTPKVALDGWKKSQGHNDVIIEKSIWKGKNFQALGVGMYKGYACCWFGIEKDNAQSADEGKESVKEEHVQEVQHAVKEEKSEETQSKPSQPEQVLGVLSSKEKELFNLINDYRKRNNLKAVSYSPCLTKVAQLHAKDVVENSPDVNGGNMHSWSDKGPWKGMVYTSDHKQSALMWSKPSELTSYKDNGYEISHGYVGNARKTMETTPKVALDGWMKSEGHNNVIIEKSIWKGTNFQALGVGMYKGYACCWFGKAKDEAKSADEVGQPEKEEEEEKPYQNQEETHEPEKKETNGGSEKILGVLSPKEKELFNMINDYRKKNNLQAVPYSPCLTKVAQVHAIDIVENSPDVDGGNMHSWSDKGPWKGMKYTDDHKQAALMWSKPSELTSYKGNGFEISHGYSGGARKTMENTPKVALDGWKSSQGHNDVIIEKSIWKGKNFQALGVGMYKGYACCWFGIEKDNAKPEDVQEPFKGLTQVKMAEKTQANSKPNTISQEIPQDIMQHMSKQMAEMMGNMNQNGFTVSKVSYSTSSNGGGGMEEMFKQMMSGMEMDGNVVEYKYEFTSN